MRKAIAISAFVAIAAATPLFAGAEIGPSANISIDAHSPNLMPSGIAEGDPMIAALDKQIAETRSKLNLEMLKLKAQIILTAPKNSNGSHFSPLLLKRVDQKMDEIRRLERSQVPR